MSNLAFVLFLSLVNAESDEHQICWLLIFRRGKSLSKVHTGINTLMLDPYF